MSWPLAANLSLLFPELPLTERVAAARQAGFDGVEIQFPYDTPAEQLASALAAAELPLVLINLPLQTDSAPQGIVSFQLAVTADQAHDILNSWHSAGHLWAQTSLWSTPQG